MLDRRLFQNLVAETFTEYLLRGLGVHSRLEDNVIFLLKTVIFFGDVA